ncbi:MAG: hypothetical protein RR364_01260 [Lachnospiraceae bacterium]
MRTTVLKIGVLLLSMGCVVTGCGDKLMKLTNEEQTMIADFSAHVVSELNSRQREGYVPISDELLLEIQEKEKTQQETAVKKEKENVSPEESKDQEKGKNQHPTGTLTEALQLSGLQAKFKGYDIKKDYIKSDVFSMTAPKGKKYLVLNVGLKNITKSKISCDLLSPKPEFVLTLNGTVKATALTTVLLNDLSTYTGKIKAKKTENMVLLFEVAEEETGSIESLSIEVTMNGTTLEVPLK